MTSFLGLGSSWMTVIEILLLNALLSYSGFAVLMAGSFSFSFVAFIGIGAYIGAILNVDHGVGYLPSLALACSVSAIASWALFFPLKRLRGIYLGLVSIALIATVQTVLLNLSSVTGGPAGKVGITSTIDIVDLIVLTASFAAAFWLIQRSNLGLAIRMLRVDPEGTATVGIDVVRVQLSLSVFAAVLGAIAGLTRAYYFGFVVPEDYGFPLLVSIVSIVVIGGATHWTGPVVGAAVVTLVPEWLRPLGEWRDIVRGAVLLLVIWQLPQGIAGGLRATWRARVTARRYASRPTSTSNQMVATSNDAS